MNAEHKLKIAILSDYNNFKNNIYSLIPLLPIKGVVFKFYDSIAETKSLVENENVPFVVSTMFKDGNTGCLDLANIIDEYAVNEKRFKAYENEDSIYEKIEKLCHMYGAKEVIYTDEAKKNRRNNKRNQGTDGVQDSP